MTTEPSRSLVLLSGGIDSATCLALAGRDGPSPVALSVAYGQPNVSELDRAARLAKRYECEMVRAELSLQWPRPPFALGDEASDAERPRHYVPARNLILLSIAMAVAEARDLDRVYLGTTIDDWRYPDARAAFIQAFGEAAAAGLQRGLEGRPIAVRTPLAGLRKADVVRVALNLGVPLELTWSCYGAGPRPCTTCGACATRREAFERVGVADPAG